MSGAITLPPAAVPDESVWQPSFGAFFHTGDNATELAHRLQAGLDVAIDTETPSVTDSFSIKCVTAAWVESGRTHTVLLDPLRRPADAAAVRTIAARARWLILHNSPFDIPGLVAAELMELRDIAKVMDTLVLARSAWPDTLVRKRLEDLAERLLGMSDFKDGLKLAQKASGLVSNEKWFREGDIHMQQYRFGAMADTVATLRIAHPLFEAAVERQLDHPFAKYGITDRGEAAALVLKAHEANRVMLRRAAIGYDINLDYLDSYVERVEIQREAARRTLEDAGLKPGVGAHLVSHLEAEGHLPAGWPRTAPTKTRPQGTLKADKDTLEEWLPDHPLAEAHRVVSDTKKILGYMEKVAARSRITGRLHPQFQMLGASATGRMSVAEPELQQFSEDARPIIVHPGGLHSIDWSSIEPALLGWMSNDWYFFV
jgi:DNA polymerase-1